jgi:hypothetical protein
VDAQRFVVGFYYRFVFQRAPLSLCARACGARKGFSSVVNGTAEAGALILVWIVDTMLVKRSVVGIVPAMIRVNLRRKIFAFNLADTYFGRFAITR